MTERPRNGLYLDDCAPHFRVKAWHVAGFVISLALWIVIIVAAIAVYRALRG